MCVRSITALNKPN